MGYNATVLVKNADLPQIRDDQHFGSRLAEMIKETANYGAPVTYAGLTVSAAQHADRNQLHVIRSGEIALFNPDSPHPDDLDLLNALVTTRNGLKPVETRASWNDGFKEDSLKEASTTLVVIVDALDRIAGDENAGSAIATGIEEYWALLGAMERREGEQGPEADFLRQYRMKMSGDITIGNHGNAASIVAITPAKQDDLVIVGQNRGRVVRPYLPDYVAVNDPQEQQLYREAHARDLQFLTRLLSDLKKDFEPSPFC